MAVLIGGVCPAAVLCLVGVAVAMTAAGLQRRSRHVIVVDMLKMQLYKYIHVESDVSLHKLCSPWVRQLWGRWGAPLLTPAEGGRGAY